jgi:hypothetical protein
MWVLTLGCLRRGVTVVSKPIPPTSVV